MPLPFPPIARCIFLLSLAIGCVANPTQSRAGISPENVIVAVNANDRDSRTIANHYASLRNIPSRNVIFLNDVPAGLTIPLDDFKKRILGPILSTANQRGIAAQTRVVAYSCGFPTSVSIPSLTERLTDANLKRYQLPVASLTGLTFFYQFAAAGSEKFLDLGANLYARGDFERNFRNPFLTKDLRGRFDAAVAERDSGNHAAAATKFESLYLEHRTIAAIAIRAAESFALADDQAAAQRMLVQAIASGWTSQRYLDESETLAPIMETGPLPKLRSRLTDHPLVSQEPVGFSSSVGWMNSGSPGASTKEGIPFLLSCMLAVVDPRGSTVEQAVQSLTISAGANSNFPDGEFWFTYTKDSRTSPRFPAIGNALKWLMSDGYDAEIIHSAMPATKSGPCVGLMLGTANMPLAEKKWSFAPGAIADNLTSFSARFDTASQTKITELLHAGAAMVCGPVYEPYNIAVKFPSPMMYGFYGSGATAIESFYLAIPSPYQQLIVGDPLASAFTRSPTDAIVIKTGRNQNDQATIQFARNRLPLGEAAASAVAMEVFIEGVQVSLQVKGRTMRVVPAIDKIELPVGGDAVGTIEVRLVQIGGGALKPRTSHTDWIRFESETRDVEITWAPDEQLIRLACDGADSIELRHELERIGEVEGESGQIKIDRQLLGDGPLRLRAVARRDSQRVPSAQLEVRD